MGSRPTYLGLPYLDMALRHRTGRGRRCGGGGVFPSVTPSCLAGFNLVFCDKFYLKTIVKSTINAQESEKWNVGQDEMDVKILKEKLKGRNGIK